MKKILIIFILLPTWLLTKSQVWNELGTLSANSTIFSTCVDGAGNVYTGGDFINSNGKRYVSKWDGANWSELGGLNGLGANNVIYSICHDALGNIYAAGDFQNSNGKRYVAKWDGVVWSEVGGVNGLAANSYIKSICSDLNGNIYAAGFFTNSNGKCYVAKWDGISWSEVGGLNGLAANYLIATICCDNFGNIYAGGAFSNSLGKNYVAKFDGVSWSALGSFNGLAPWTNLGILSICSDNSGNIFAAGDFTLDSSSISYPVAKWDGITWNVLGGVNGLQADNKIFSICSDSSGNIYASGDFQSYATMFIHTYVAKWDGVSWSDIGPFFSTYRYSCLNVDAIGNIYVATGPPYTSGINSILKYSSCWYNSSVSQISCDNYVFSGQTYTSSGTYYKWLFNTNTCDTLMTLHLLINQSDSSNLTQSACDNFTLNSQTYSSSGIYNQLLTNSSGCDSLLTLNLTVNQSTSSILSQNICNSYTLNGQTYTSSGIYNQQFINSVGCDSTLTINLIIDTIDNGVQQFGNTLLSNSSGAIYQWVTCPTYSAILGATNQSYNATSNGDYAVMITKGSCLDTSNCYKVIGVGMQDYYFSDLMQVSPNPTNNEINILMNKELKNASLKILNISGQIILQEDHLYGKKITIDLSKLSKGIYFLELKGTDNLYKAKVEKE